MIFFEKKLNWKYFFILSFSTLVFFLSLSLGHVYENKNFGKIFYFLTFYPLILVVCLSHFFSFFNSPKSLGLDFLNYFIYIENNKIALGENTNLFIRKNGDFYKFRIESDYFKVNTSYFYLSEKNLDLKKLPINSPHIHLS